MVGADVEVFLRDIHTKEIVSAEGYIKGTKDHPFCFDKANKFFAISLDNVLAEFCIPPCKTKLEFYNNLQKSFGYINQSIPPQFQAVATPAARLDDKFLQTEHSQLFGCEPDFNAYTCTENEKPKSLDANLRSAGGHIHISWDGATPYNEKAYIVDEERTNLIKAFDLFVGIPSVILEPDNKRKELYGKAGAFRPKKYGVEYRTISNFYLAEERLTNWVYDAVQNAITWVNNGNNVDYGLGDYIQETINTNNKENANHLIKHFQLNIAA